MEILKDLKEFEEYCLKNNDLNAELVYNAQETIQVLIEDRARLIAAAEELVDLMEDVRTGDYIPDSFTTQPMRMAIKDAKGEQDG